MFDNGHQIVLLKMKVEGLQRNIETLESWNQRLRGDLELLMAHLHLEITQVNERKVISKP